MVILRATSILGGQKEDKGMICSIPLFFNGSSCIVHNNHIKYEKKICSFFSASFNFKNW
jgi:hypothetical protein